ncbi:hypothetical protein SAMN05444483_101627 [Salegentibacter echinorum]|uniref:Sugar lactone lactonase YvrE n=1 Tax=Salegentibacter echinorum TaxID=1073325 RepID=A0A1M5CQP3_SALEC|nr:hypothetical protein [Salegentibacter echinorum]SHF57051.1 hypothetical protein SAMN05444483_101627 [Salegentibacter echinorum]
MKTFSFRIFIFFLLISAGSFAQRNPATLIKKISGFSHPESVIYHKANDVYFVTNMAEDSDGDGFISKVSKEGEIIKLKWITGLKDPKGMLIKEDTLYVTNNTELIRIAIGDARIIERIAVEGAVSLNDITIDEDGNIFISDSGRSAIYMISSPATEMMVPEEQETEIVEYLDSKRLQYPNGLFARNKDLYVAAWGENGKGSLLKVAIEFREITKISKKGIGNLDGIQPVGKEAFYISDWATGTIYLAGKNGDLQEVLTSEKSAGDILFLPDSNQLILPMNHQNELWWYQLQK